MYYNYIRILPLEGQMFKNPTIWPFITNRKVSKKNIWKRCSGGKLSDFSGNNNYVPWLSKFLKLIPQNVKSELIKMSTQQCE